MEPDRKQPEPADQPQQAEAARGADAERARADEGTRAEEEEESLKVHGDKYEGLIPRNGGQPANE